MIKVSNLIKRYGDVTAVNNISFEIDSGKIYGFLGPNGAGKSTTLNIISGCLAPDSGIVEINGYDIFNNPVEAKKHIGFLPEIPPLYLDMTPYEYLRFISEVRNQGESNPEELVEIMRRVGILDVSDRLISTLSKGYKQRVGIASTMISNPEVIILDEPTVGLDPMQIHEIRELIKELGKDHTVIFSSHILSEITALCDDLIIINNGNIAEYDDLNNIVKKYNTEKIITVKVINNDNSAYSIIKDFNEVNDVTESIDDNLLIYKVIFCDDYIDNGDLLKSLINNGFTVVDYHYENKSLENIFYSIIDNDITDISKNEDDDSTVSSDYDPLFEDTTDTESEKVEE